MDRLQNFDNQKYLPLGYSCVSGRQLIEKNYILYLIDHSGKITDSVLHTYIPIDFLKIFRVLLTWDFLRLFRVPWRFIKFHQGSQKGKRVSDS